MVTRLREREGIKTMKEIKMSRKVIEEMIKDVVENHEPCYIGTAGMSITNGKIITKIDTIIAEMGLREKVKTWCNSGEWYVVRNYHFA